ncbi:MAG TPA: type II secretion system F family protein [Elusimicrobiales bacterium]|nr:type II secretion system F family protein [Elusimicrobiales bacterium]
MAKFYGSFIRYARIQAKPHPGINEEDLISLFEHLSTLLNAGVPLMRGLKLTVEQTQSIKLQNVIREITARVSGGASLFEAMQRYPKVFPFQWTQIVRIGEQSGQLAPLLEKLNANIKKRSALTGKIKSALIYPTIMACVAVGCIFVMLWKVIPTFAAFFADFGSKLPPITQFVLDLSNLIQQRGLIIVALAVVGFLLFKRFISTDYGGRQFFSLLMALPVVGELVVQAAQEKLASDLTLLLKSGMPLLDSIKSAQDATKGNPIYYDALGEVHMKISTGGDLGSALESTGFYTKMTIGMVRMGEESGKLPEVLDLVANYYSSKVELLTMRLTTMLEPLIVIGMGVVVALMLASVYLPMFQLSGATSGG